MRVNDELIQKFIKGQCNPKEAGIIAEWLREHPDGLDSYYNEEEWMQETGQELPDTEWDNVWAGVDRQRVRLKRLRLIKYTAAACVVLLILAGLVYWPGSRDTAGGRMAGTSPAGVTDKDLIVWHNDTDTVRRVVTADSSVVYLEGHARISYSRNRWRTARDIVLEGDARFNVAKDKLRPFTVFSNGVAVKALGTVFSIQADSIQQTTKVRLYEGSVKVVPDGQKTSQADSAFSRLLLPGQELVLKEKQLPYVWYFMKGREQDVFVKHKPGTDQAQPLVPSGWFEFSSQQLEEVFTALEVLYGVEIEYNRKNIQNMFFIGRFEPSDSIDDILQTIALLNNLKIEKKAASRFQVTRSLKTN